MHRRTPFFEIRAAFVAAPRLDGRFVRPRFSKGAHARRALRYRTISKFTIIA